MELNHRLVSVSNTGTGPKAWKSIVDKALQLLLYADSNANFDGHSGDEWGRNLDVVLKCQCSHSLVVFGTTDLKACPSLILHLISLVSQIGWAFSLNFVVQMYLHICSATIGAVLASTLIATRCVHLEKRKKKSPNVLLYVVENIKLLHALQLRTCAQRNNICERRAW